MEEPMCKEEPQILKDIEKDVGKGWLPLVAVLGQVKLEDGELIVVVSDLHFLWAVSPQLAQKIGVALIVEMQKLMAEERMHYERRN